MDPTARFTGLADLYAQARPSYPVEAVDFIVWHANLDAGSLVVDVGCGTGISSRLFAERGLKVIGIEPNEEMAMRAASSISPNLASLLTIERRKGEDTGCAADSVDLVLCAQAFHWLDAETAFAEFKRILKPAGWVVLMWNERDESDPLMQGYGEAFRSLTDAVSVEAHRIKAGEPLLTCPLFEHAERRVFPNSQEVDEQGLIDRAFSASYAPKVDPEAGKLKQSLKGLFHEHEKNHRVTLRYQTSIYLARKPAPAAAQ